jgi:hypothetical protein
MQIWVLFHQVERKTFVELCLSVKCMDPLPEYLTVVVVCDKWLTAVRTCNVRLGEVILPNGDYFSVTGKLYCKDYF